MVLPPGSHSPVVVPPPSNPAAPKTLAELAAQGAALAAQQQAGAFSGYANAPAEQSHGRAPCKFFAQGNCRNGDACRFSHDEAAFAPRSAESLQLTADALSALSGLSPPHAQELVEQVARRVPALRDPSTYIISIVNKGFVSKKDGSASGGAKGGGPPSWSSYPTDPASLADVEARSREAALELGQEALHALASLPSQHAAELVDTVSKKMQQGNMRDPSNFIVATVNKGFQSKAEWERGGGKGYHDGRGWPDGKGYSDSWYSKGGDATAGSSWHEPHHLQGGCEPAELAGCEGMLRAQQASIVLTDEALQALMGLPLVHASELLDRTASKHGELRDPSNFILATIAKGFVSRLDGSTSGGGSAGSGAPSWSASTAPSAPCADDRGLAFCDGMQKAQSAGIQLTDEALSALKTVPLPHASEILDHVAMRYGQGELRDPSNFICATVAKGFTSRVDGSTSGGKGNPNFVHKPQEGGKGGYSEYGGSQGYSDWDYGGKDAWKDGKGGKKGGKDKGKKGPSPLARQMLTPPDASVVEMKVLELNDLNLWDNSIDAATLLALRCVTHEQAMELLNQLLAKGHGKGKGIANVNNYIQAAIYKVVRAEQGGGSPAAAGYEGMYDTLGLATMPQAALQDYSYASAPGYDQHGYDQQGVVAQLAAAAAANDPLLQNQGVADVIAMLGLAANQIAASAGIPQSQGMPLVDPAAQQQQEQQQQQQQLAAASSTPSPLQALVAATQSLQMQQAAVQHYETGEVAALLSGEDPPAKRSRFS